MDFEYCDKKRVQNKNSLGHETETERISWPISRCHPKAEGLSGCEQSRHKVLQPEWDEKKRELCCLLIAARCFLLAMSWMVSPLQFSSVTAPSLGSSQLKTEASTNCELK